MAHLNKQDGFSVSLKNTIKFNKTFCCVILIMGFLLFAGCMGEIKLNKANRKIIENTSMLQVVSRGLENELYLQRHDAELFGTGLIAIGQMILAKKRGREMYEKYNVKNPIKIVESKFLKNISSQFNFSDIKKFPFNKSCYAQEDCYIYASPEEKILLKGVILEIFIWSYILIGSDFRPFKSDKPKNPVVDYSVSGNDFEEGEILYDFILVIKAKITNFNGHSIFWKKTCKINSGSSPKFKDDINIKPSSLKELTENDGKLLRKLSNMVAEECANQLSAHLLNRDGN